MIDRDGHRVDVAADGVEPLSVLHLPVNIASILSHGVRAEQEIGLAASGVVYGSPTEITSQAGVEVVSLPRLRHVHRWPPIAADLERRARGADVVHWYFGTHVMPMGLDLRAIRRSGTPGVVELLGSDVRDPAVECADNPYYAEAWESGYEYRSLESTAHSHEAQREFTDAGLIPVVSYGIVQYLLPDVLERAVVVERGVLLDDYEFRPPDPERKVPRIVHAPSAPVAKGTRLIEAALDELARDFEFEYERVEGVERSSALELVARADVFIDQVVLGDYGMAAIEAMAMGKPTVVWVKPEVRKRYPVDAPFVNASADELAESLAPLLGDAGARHELGARSRAYVEGLHDARKRAVVMAGVYREMV